MDWPRAAPVRTLAPHTGDSTSHSLVGRFRRSHGPINPPEPETNSVYVIDQAGGALEFLDKYPTGKGANRVVMSSFE